MPHNVVVLGARNLGGAIIDHFLARGWNAAGVARSEETLDRVRSTGALALQADASDPHTLASALERARRELGSLDAVVNAVSASSLRLAVRSGEGSSLRPMSKRFVAGRSRSRSRRSFSSALGRARYVKEGGGALVQITGGSARRAIAGKGLWAAGAFATRALVQAAAQELRGEGIHAALLAVDATIESPKTAARARDMPTNSLAEMSQIASAVEFLVSQQPRGLTHELVVTPAGERWAP